MSARAAYSMTLAFALAFAAGGAGAGTVVDVTAGATTGDDPGVAAGAGFAIGADFGADNWLSLELRLDGTERGSDHPVSLTFGPRLGSNQGAVRPYFELALGFSGGASDAGLVAGYGAGVIVDLPSPFAVVAYARSIAMGNMEYSAHQAEYRAGLAFRSGRTRR